MVESATALKDKGNTLFQEKRYEAALQVYHEALAALDAQSTAPEGLAGEKSLRCTLLTNRAACYLQLQRHEECVKVSATLPSTFLPPFLLCRHHPPSTLPVPLAKLQETTAALDIDGSRVKAVYRRAQVGWMVTNKRW